MAIMGVLGVVSWSGWVTYQAHQKTRERNAELVDTYRTVFQAEQVQEAARMLREREEAVSRLPEPEAEPQPEVEGISEEMEEHAAGE